MLLALGIEVPGGRLEVGRIAERLGMDVDGVLADRQILQVQLDDQLILRLSNVAVPASSPVLVLIGTTTSVFGFFAKAGTARRQQVSAVMVLRMGDLQSGVLLSEYRSICPGCVAAGGYVCKIWLMISGQFFSFSKFMASLCLFAVPPMVASSVALAQRNRGGQPPAAQTPAGDARPAGAEPKPAAADANSIATPGMPLAEPPLPPDAHVEQSIQIEGKTLHYTVTVGTLPVRDSKGALSGEVVFTAYTVEGKDRPVTFAFNGGPGAASVYLNLGASGRRR